MRTEKATPSAFLFHFGGKGRSQPSLGKHSSGSSGAGGGSLRMKLLGGHKSSVSQPLNTPPDPAPKSASLQALSGSIVAGPAVADAAEAPLHGSSSTHSSDPKPQAAPARDGRAQTMSSWGTAGTPSLNKDLANGDSGSNRSMGSGGEHRGSRSSGQQSSIPGLLVPFLPASFLSSHLPSTTPVCLPLHSRPPSPSPSTLPRYYAVNVQSDAWMFC